MRSLVCAGLVGLIFSGCGSSGTVAPTAAASIVGQYALRSIDGVSLPARIIDQPTVRMTVGSGSFSLLSAGEVTGTMETRFEVTGAASQTQTTTYTGTYSLAGNSLSVTTTSTTSGASSATATFSATVTSPGRLEFRWTDGKKYLYTK